MTPDTMKVIEVAVTALLSGGAAALGNSRAMRRAFAKLRRRVAALEKGHGELREHAEKLDAAHEEHRRGVAALEKGHGELLGHAEKSDAAHEEHRRAASWSAGALHQVGLAIGVKVAARPSAPSIVMKGP